MEILSIVPLVVGFCAIFSITESCKLAFEDPCRNVGCPSGTICQPDSSYYCENRFGQVCKPVAVCVEDPSTVQDPCLNFACPDGNACVKVLGPSEQSQPATFIAQCNVKHRSGQCPSPDSNTQITDCHNYCFGTDEMCEKNHKCCSSQTNAEQRYCVAPVLA